MGVLSEMMANSELDELWSDPAVAHRLLQGKIHCCLASGQRNTVI